MAMPNLNRYRPAGRPPKHPEGHPSLRVSILDKAILVFAEKGILASTLAEISQRAKITPATLYYHFSCRENLVEETLEHHLIPQIRYVWAAAGEVEDPVEMLEEIHRRMLEVARASPWFLPLWSRELASEGGTLREFLASRIHTPHRDQFIEKTRLGQATGLINPDLVPELLFISLVGSVYPPLLSKKNWEKVFNAEISEEKALHHIQSLLTEGLIRSKEVRHE